jgi:hypothetical protein
VIEHFLFGYLVIWLFGYLANTRVCLCTTTLLARITLTTVRAYSIPIALLAMIALTAVRADSTPAALLARRALTTVRAYL